jgi:hypothetical protein
MTAIPPTHIAPVLGCGRVMQPGADGGDTRDMTRNDKSLLRIGRALLTHTSAPEILQFTFYALAISSGHGP